MKHLFKYLAGLALVAIAGVALAQQVVLPSAMPLSQGDYVQVIKGGAPQAQSYYAPAGTLGGMLNYLYSVPLTGFTITPANGTTFVYLNPAGTLATGTLTMPAIANDGQEFCLTDTQTQTAITISANTGQSLGGIAAPTALVANTIYCWFYRASASTWIRYQ